MKTNKCVIAVCAIMLLFPACKLKKIVSVNDYYPPTAGRLHIYQTGQSLPNNIIRIGSIEVGESGFTPPKECSYEKCITTIEDEAKKKGADIVYLVTIKEPGFWSSCYNITAELYKYANE